ncbi:MAG: aminodeoxychorismate lyase [Gammaproteobacteria bacterium]|nr:aminodeoxychorismate lyase [Gammaproteobacteria bacterium]
MNRILINGISTSSIDSRDRGFQYGDGLFETLLYVRGKIFFWQQHMQRLTTGCERLGLPVVDEAQWLADIEQLSLGADKAVIKLMLTRGIGGRGYKLPEAVDTTRITARYDFVDYPLENTEQGVQTIICKTPVSVNASLAGLKHINRLDNVLARNEWSDPDIMEGLMMDDRGNIIEGTMTNVFCVKDNVVYTPRLDRAGIDGIIRNEIIRLAGEQEIVVKQEDISVNDLQEMDEVFLTNSLAIIWPVIKINNRVFVKGEVTARLMSVFNMDEGAYIVGAY